MRLVRRWTREAAKPREDRLALSDGKARESVRTLLGYEGGEYLGRRRDELRGKNGRKEVDEGLLRAGRKMTDGRDHEAGRQIARVNVGSPFRQREAAAVTGWAQQKHVVGIDHRAIGALAVPRPDGAAIEGAERLGPGRHVAEPSEPHEAVGIVEIAELADHGHADRLLRLDEFAVEQVDERLAPARMKTVAPKLHDGALDRSRVHGSPRLIQPFEPLAARIGRRR